MNNPINVDLSQMKTEACECGCPFFVQKMVIKRVPALITCQPQDVLANISFQACDNCGKPNNVDKNLAAILSNLTPPTSQDEGDSKVIKLN